MSASKEDWQVAALEAGIEVDRCRQKLRRSEKARERLETAARSLLAAYEVQGPPCL